MKFRTGFVSNSSSSSFSIKKELLNGKQIDQIKNHIKVAQEMSDDNDFGKYISYRPDSCDEWSIDEDENKIYGSTIMDNFDIYTFMRLIGVSDEVVKEEEYW